MPRIDTRAAAVVVARSRAHGGELNVQPSRSAPVRLAVGQRLVVNHAFDYEEASWQRETFGFFLEAEAAGDRKRSRTVVRERPLLGAAGKGCVAVAYRFAKPGRYTLHYRARAEYRVAAWGRPSRPAPGRLVEGRLRVLVSAAK